MITSEAKSGPKRVIPQTGKSTKSNETESVKTWPRYPTVFEINTWVWLNELSRRYRKSIDLSSVPALEWDALASDGFDAVWLMGVWERSPAGITIANKNQQLQQSFREGLQDFRPDDNVGSPYCVRRYVVDSHVGGPEGLCVARAELAKRGIKLLLDLVANHVAPDHPWATEQAEFFIRGSVDDLRKDPTSYLQVGTNILACGRDPYFPAWPDVLQLNAFNPELRHSIIKGVSEIAQQCDGVRCDMAMLLMNDVFERTWGSRAGGRPATEFWVDVIRDVKKVSPNFLFIAEAYWDLEWELQKQGFDFCYDKKLYDRLVHGNAESVRLHLCGDPVYQDKLLRFIENHDEPRAAKEFGPQKLKAALVTMATVPGARLFHDGQLEGRKVRLPVFLGRRPDEQLDSELFTFYRKLLSAVDSSLLHDGQWSLCAVSGWPDNGNFRNLVAWEWRKEDDRNLIIVNLSETASDARVKVTSREKTGKSIRLVDLFSDVTYVRSGDEIATQGLYVKLGAWEFHFFRVLT